MVKSPSPTKTKKKMLRKTKASTAEPATPKRKRGRPRLRPQTPQSSSTLRKQIKASPKSARRSISALSVSPRGMKRKKRILTRSNSARRSVSISHSSVSASPPRGRNRKKKKCAITKDVRQLRSTSPASPCIMKKRKTISSLKYTHGGSATPVTSPRVMKKKIASLKSAHGSSVGSSASPRVMKRKKKMLASAKSAASSLSTMKKKKGRARKTKESDTTFAMKRKKPIGDGSSVMKKAKAGRASGNKMLGMNGAESLGKECENAVAAGKRNRRQLAKLALRKTRPGLNALTASSRHAAGMGESGKMADNDLSVNGDRGAVSDSSTHMSDYRDSDYDTTSSEESGDDDETKKRKRRKKRRKAKIDAEELEAWLAANKPCPEYYDRTQKDDCHHVTSDWNGILHYMGQKVTFPEARHTGLKSSIWDVRRGRIRLRLDLDRTLLSPQDESEWLKRLELCKKYENYCGRPAVDPLTPHVDADDGLADDDPAVMECMNTYVRLSTKDFDDDFDNNFKKPARIQKEVDESLAKASDNPAHAARLESKVGDAWKNFFSVFTYFDRGDDFYEDTLDDYRELVNTFEDFDKRHCEVKEEPEEEDAKKLPENKASSSHAKRKTTRKPLNLPDWWPERDFTLVTPEEREKLANVFVTRESFIKAGLHCQDTLNAKNGKPTRNQIQTFWKQMVNRQIQVSKPVLPYRAVVKETLKSTDNVSGRVERWKKEQKVGNQPGDSDSDSIDMKKAGRAVSPPRTLVPASVRLKVESMFEEALDKGDYVDPRYKEFFVPQKEDPKELPSFPAMDNLGRVTLKSVEDIETLMQNKKFYFYDTDDLENNTVLVSDDDEERKNPFYVSDRREAEGFHHTPAWFPGEETHEQCMEAIDKACHPERYDGAIIKEDLWVLEGKERRKARKQNLAAFKDRAQKYWLEVGENKKEFEKARRIVKMEDVEHTTASTLNAHAMANLSQDEKKVGNATPRKNERNNLSPASRASPRKGKVAAMPAIMDAGELRGKGAGKTSPCGSPSKKSEVEIAKVKKEKTVKETGKAALTIKLLRSMYEVRKVATRKYVKPKMENTEDEAHTEQEKKKDRQIAGDSNATRAVEDRKGTARGAKKKTAGVLKDGQKIKKRKRQKRKAVGTFGGHTKVKAYKQFRKALDSLSARITENDSIAENEKSDLITRIQHVWSQNKDQRDGAGGTPTSASKKPAARWTMDTSPTASLKKGGNRSASVHDGEGKVRTPKSAQTNKGRQKKQSNESTSSDRSKSAHKGEGKLRTPKSAETDKERQRKQSNESTSPDRGQPEQKGAGRLRTPKSAQTNKERQRKHSNESTSPDRSNFVHKCEGKLRTPKSAETNKERQRKHSSESASPDRGKLKHKGEEKIKTPKSTQTNKKRQMKQGDECTSSDRERKSSKKENQKGVAAIKREMLLKGVSKRKLENIKKRTGLLEKIGKEGAVARRRDMVLTSESKQKSKDIKKK